MKPGKYFVGDLCYIMHDKWDEFCNDLMPGEHTFSDGTVCSWAFTKYGDGVYRDEEGREYPVDAGLIGCILFDQISEKEKKNIKPSNGFVAGHIIEFKEEFEVSEWEGIICFGEEVEINTGPQSNDDDDSEEDYDDDDQEDESLSEDNDPNDQDYDGEDDDIELTKMAREIFKDDPIMKDHPKDCDCNEKCYYQER